MQNSIFYYDIFCVLIMYFGYIHPSSALLVFFPSSHTLFLVSSPLPLVDVVKVFTVFDVYVCVPVCVYMHHVLAGARKARRVHQIL